MSNDEADVAALDAIVIESDLQGGTDAQWAAADALYKKAEIVERRDGPRAAVDLYTEVARRLDGVREPGPRELLMCALHDAANIHHDLGHMVESRSAAERLVADHFDAPPDDTVDVLVSATLLLATLRHDAGEPDRALELLEDLLERYGQPGAPDHELTAAAADASAAWIIGNLGRADEGIRRYDRVIAALGRPADEIRRTILARSLGRQGKLLYDAGRPSEGKARLDELIERFADDATAEIAEQVEWARETLEYHGRAGARRFGLRRRSSHTR